MAKSKYIGAGMVLPFIKAHTKPIDNLVDARSNRSVTVRPDLNSHATNILRLRELKGHPTLSWPPQIPEFDPRGIATGEQFTCWKKAKDGKDGVSGNWYSKKTGTVQSCHSLLEARLRGYFDLCPFVVDCRTQYPSWNRDEHQRYLTQGKRFPANKVMSIDFMLALSVPGSNSLHYHGVSAKPRALTELPEVIARHAKEASRVGTWGSTHEIMDEFTIPDIEYSNHLLLKSWFLWTDVEEHMTKALELANLLKRTSAVGPLDRIVPMLGRRIGADRNRSYSLLGVAVFLGYIWLDHSFALSIDAPLKLAVCKSGPQTSMQPHL